MKRYRKYDLVQCQCLVRSFQHFSTETTWEFAYISGFCLEKIGIMSWTKFCKYNQFNEKLNGYECSFNGDEKNFQQIHF